MPVKLPNRLNSETLKRLAVPGEPFLLILATNVGDVSPYELTDENGRSYIFRWDVKEGCHVLRVPVSVWTQNRRAMALALFDTRTRNGPNLVPVPEFQSQGGAEAARLVHTQEVAGSSPAPATTMRPVEAASVLTPYDVEAIAKATSDALPSVEIDGPTAEDAEDTEDARFAAAELELPTESDDEEFLHVAIAREVASKPMRVADLVEKFGATKEEVVAAIAYEDSGLVNASGWVKLKTD